MIQFTAFSKKYGLYRTASESWGRLRLALAALRGSLKVLVTLFLLACVLTLISLNVLLVQSIVNESLPTSAVIAFIVFDIGALGLIAGGLHVYGRRSLQMRTFATDNNFTFTHRGNPGTVNGVLFQFGFRRIARNIIQGTVSDKKFTFFDYRAIKGTGRYQYPELFTVLIVDMKRSVPAVLCANNNGYVQKLTNLYSTQQTVEDSSLLGKNFTVYGDISSEELSRLLPETVVASLVEASSTVDLELKDNSLFVYLRGEVRDSHTLERVFEAAQQV